MLTQSTIDMAIEALKRMRDSFDGYRMAYTDATGKIAAIDAAIAELQADAGVVSVPDWLRAFPPEWDRHPWANYAYLQPSSSLHDGITFKWYYFECEPEWGEKSYNWVDGTHGWTNPVTRAPLSIFFDVRQTLQARPQPPQEQGA